MRPTKPAIERRQAETWARERYGIEATAAELPGEIDRNFLLTARDGSRRVLKVSPGGAIPLEIESQLAALRHLEHTEVGSLVPRVVPDLDGEVSSPVDLRNGDRGMLRMVTYLDGRPLARLDQSNPGLRRQIGRTLGRLDRALASFDHPGATRKLVWDIRRVLELRSLVDLLQSDLRPQVVHGLDRFAERVEPRLGDLRVSVVHNDANDHNLLVNEDDAGRPQLCGLIDFGDMLHSITVAELAIACAYAMLDVDDPSAAADDVTAGYEEALPLDTLERELLGDLIVARLCASVLLSAQARQTSPGDDYLIVSERAIADLLRRLGASP